MDCVSIHVHQTMDAEVLPANTGANRAPIRLGRAHFVSEVFAPILLYVKQTSEDCGD